MSNANSNTPPHPDPLPEGEGEMRRVLRWSAGSLEQHDDAVVIEEPLEIRVRGRAISVTTRTPGHDDELAARREQIAQCGERSGLLGVGWDVVEGEGGEDEVERSARDRANVAGLDHAVVAGGIAAAIVSTATVHAEKLHNRPAYTLTETAFCTRPNARRTKLSGREDASRRARVMRS